MPTNTDNSLVDIPAVEVVSLPAVQGNPYMPMIDRFLASGGDIDKLDKILDLKDRWDKSEAEKAYNAAKAAFKANPPDVYKDKKNKQYDSQYTSIGNMVNTVSAALSPHGLSASWDIDQSDAKNITVTCILVHAMGHRESVKMSGPPDDTGQKNALQKIKSTVTYLKLATFEAVTGVASKEGNLDDDGNGAGRPQNRPAHDAVATAAANREAAAKASPAAAAVQATTPPDSPERDAAKKEAEDVCSLGVQAFRDMWAGWDKAKRKLVNDLVRTFQALAIAADEARTIEQEQADE